MARGLVFVAALIFSVPIAYADEYVYHGNPFDTFVNGARANQFTSANAVVFSFVTVSGLPINSTFNLTSIVAGNFVLSPSVTSGQSPMERFLSISSSVGACWTRHS